MPSTLTGTDEFASLCESAADLGIAHAEQVRYVSRNKVINHLRLHLLEWGDPAQPDHRHAARRQPVGA